MRTETLERTIYTFDELSDDAKETAREPFRQLDHEWWDAVYDDFDRIAAIMGIDVDQKQFSGFWSQGDGACFTGTYSYKKGATKAIREYAPKDEELHEIADTLQTLQRPYFYGLTASITTSGRYSHSGTMSVDADTDKTWRDIGADIESDLADVFRSLAYWLYSTLEKDYEFLTSDEQIDELIDGNGYEFTEIGKLI